MQHINWTALLLCVIWLCATIATCVVHDTTPFGAALVATLAIGFGYFMLRAD